MDKYSGLIEAILFYEAEVVQINKLNRLTGLQEEVIREMIDELNEEYDKGCHGIHIVEIAEGFTFQVKKEILNDIKEIYNLKDKSKLSKSALTVLSIIAYKQPITKNEIEDIRGVNSDNPVRVLMEKNLIEIVGRKEVLGKPLMYGTSKEFLKHFNLKSIEDLPKIEELKTTEFDTEE